MIIGVSEEFMTTLTSKLFKIEIITSKFDKVDNSNLKIVDYNLKIYVN